MNGLIKLLSKRINTIKDVFNLMRLEAKLAYVSFYRLIINLIMSLIALTSTWLTLLVFLTYEMACYFHNWTIALLSALALNILLVTIFSLLIKSNLKSMRFEHTREYLLQTSEKGKKHGIQKATGKKN